MNLNEPVELAILLEALLLAHNQPLTIDRIESLFDEEEKPSTAQIHEALQVLADNCQARAYELKEVASGYRLQVRSDFAPWVSRLWEEKPQRYSRALLETLALIAYRQPITRGEIEDIRGVAVNSQIIKTLQERDWIRVVGYKDVPGKPAMLATTKAFLDYFNLKSLEELPALSSIKPIQEEFPILVDELTVEVEQDLIVTDQQVIENEEDQAPQSEKSFKNLLEEWDQLEQGVKIDFSDLLPESVKAEPEE
ncbi:SMC-Scp complex subunit ScpB [Entomomonas asaccharolytica]|uniref:SMC-Scp complex subunit ScpB n=1 Tax=Entomomonas asaccharolytica TaxID=2785331 RepID=A0A974NFA6_9GAMM|nr:SMC-Scp complex subunit ScpB [Entomomonas asaccharolytica]QQP85710.1 SMC-Scp complex subunit ScpB [Entomomonas asaccharolytica]